MPNILENVYFTENLIELEINASDSEAALRRLAKNLRQEDLVTDTFSDAIIQREKVFPTGLALESVGVAIPHTDVEHVKKQAMAIGILKNPVKFIMMGTEDVEVEVSVLFMLAIEEPHAQLEFLQALMELFQNGPTITDIVNSKTKSEVMTKFKQSIS